MGYCSQEFIRKKIESRFGIGEEQTLEGRVEEILNECANQKDNDTLNGYLIETYIEKVTVKEDIANALNETITSVKGETTVVKEEEQIDV